MQSEGRDGAVNDKIQNGELGREQIGRLDLGVSRQSLEGICKGNHGNNE